MTDGGHVECIEQHLLLQFGRVSHSRVQIKGFRHSQSRKLVWRLGDCPCTERFLSSFVFKKNLKILGSGGIYLHELNFKMSQLTVWREMATDSRWLQISCRACVIGSQYFTMPHVTLHLMQYIEFQNSARPGNRKFLDSTFTEYLFYCLGHLSTRAGSRTPRRQQNAFLRR